MAVVELTRAEDGQTIRVHPGDEVVVRLSENPTTGFRWEVDTADPILVPIGDAFELGEPALVGSGGTREFRFRVADSEGTGRLALKHREPWEGDASVTDRLTVDFAVES